jgi:acyl-CoA thioester hydrolase|tara:strand:- start:599 stop:1006 length:408 start_codon:yes stop_codon:yes gene_type:complete
MINGEIKLRVRYSDTDQMGYVYYGRYASYYEIARVELFRSLGFSYKKLEEEGIGMPVIDMETKYILPIKYDERIKIKTIIENLPLSRICFKYEIYNQNNKLANTAITTLTFINLTNKKPVRMPVKLLDIIKSYFK